MKKAYSLFELILVIFISSIVLIYTFKYIKQLNQTQIESEKIAMLKIDLNSTKIIIEKNLPTIKNELKLIDTILYWDKNILLKDVTFFEIKTSSNILIINIKVENKISQTWKFKL